jgi:hypothetical protein
MVVVVMVVRMVVWMVMLVMLCRMHVGRVLLVVLLFSIVLGAKNAAFAHQFRAQGHRPRRPLQAAVFLPLL